MRSAIATLIVAAFLLGVLAVIVGERIVEWLRITLS